MDRSIEEVARMLAQEHREDDPAVQEIYWAPAESEVRLIEITEAIGDHREVLPFRFSPQPPDVPYPSVVILLSPRDWEAVSKRRLSLPDSFPLDGLKKIA